MDATTETNVNTGDDELALPSQIKPPSQNLATSVPCLIVLKYVSAELKGKTSVRIPHTKEEMCKVEGCLKWINQSDCVLPRFTGQKRQREHDNGRPSRKAKNSVKYVFTDATSGENAKTEPNPDLSDKSAPSGYRLAAHHYMVARKQGLIEGPRTRTRALKIAKIKQLLCTDSEATVDYGPDTASNSRRCKPRKKKISTGSTCY